MIRRELKSAGTECERSGGVQWHSLITLWSRGSVQTICAAFRLGYLDEARATEFDLEIRKVGTPLAGLIASERLKINTRTAGGIVFVFLLGTQLM